MPKRWPHDPPAFGRVRVEVRKHLRTHALTGPVYAGVSGGPDSLALLAGLVTEGAQVTALVVDHNLQPGSAEVAAAAAQQARAWGAAARVLPVAVGRRGGMEAAARTARLEALEQAAGGAPVFLGHTLDDQAESFLLGGLRGGPGGMTPVRGVFHRPLLGVRRRDTVAACAELEVSPWHDPANEDSDVLRVRVRAELLPQMRTALNFDPAPALAQGAGRAAAEHAAVQQWAQAVDATDVHALSRLPEAVRHEAIAGLIRAAGGRLHSAQVGDVDKLVMQWHGQGPVDVGRGRKIGRKNGRLIVED